MDTKTAIYLSAELTIGIITVTGNSIVLAAIIRNRPLHTIPNIFVANLAIADIIVGSLVVPLIFVSSLGLPRNNFYGCVFVNSLVLVFTNASIVMLVAVAFDRFFSIKAPLTYQRVMTVRKAMFVVFCAWMVGITLGLVPLYGWNSGYRKLERCKFTDVITYEYLVYFQFLVMIVTPTAIMSCVYAYIFVIVRRHSMKIHALNLQMLRQRPEGDTPDAPQRAEEAREERRFNRNVRAAKMFARVIVGFSLKVPINILNTLSLFCDSCNVTFDMVRFAIVVSHSNSSINPLIYAFTNPLIRKAIKNMFRCGGEIEDLGARLTDVVLPERTSRVAQPDQTEGEQRGAGEGGKPGEKPEAPETVQFKVGEDSDQESLQTPTVLC